MEVIPRVLIVGEFAGVLIAFGVNNDVESLDRGFFGVIMHFDRGEQRGRCVTGFQRVFVVPILIGLAVGPVSGIVIYVTHIFHVAAAEQG